MSNAAGQDKLADEIYQVLIGYKCATQIEDDGDLAAVTALKGGG